MSPTILIKFSAEPNDPGDPKYTQNLSLVITEHLKFVSGQQIFSTARESPPKPGE